jgi:hypothetical protein
MRLPSERPAVNCWLPESGRVAVVSETDDTQSPASAQERTAIASA